jgi:hypothetical protein
MWIGTWLVSSIVLLATSVAVLVGSIWMMETIRPCWDFDPASVDIVWPVDADDVSTLDLTPSERSDVRRWLDAGCTEETFDFVAFVLVVATMLPGLLLLLAAAVAPPIVATMALRRSQARDTSPLSTEPGPGTVDRHVSGEDEP